MGNCLRHESTMMWGGEDWGSPAGDEGDRGEMTGRGMVENEEKGLLNVTSRSRRIENDGNSSSCSTTEVKIKITKKQLEELLGKVDVKDLSVQQVLAQLINVTNGCQAQQLRSWRPALQSIPEL